MNPICNANVLLYFGDSITTDHISPAGTIARASPAARYLSERGLTPREFNSYGSRRGNHAVMSRGTFANIRLANKLISPVIGPKTLYLNGLDKKQNPIDIYDAAEMYKSDSIPVILIAGKDYGSGSSRDWAVKGPFLLGVRAVIAVSFDRIHRSNLIGMGIIPFQFLEDQSAQTLQLTGREKFSILIEESFTIKKLVDVQVSFE